MKNTIDLGPNGTRDFGNFLKSLELTVPDVALVIYKKKQKNFESIKRRLYRWTAQKSNTNLKVSKKELEETLEAVGYSILAYPHLPDAQRERLTKNSKEDVLLGHWFFYAYSSYEKQELIEEVFDIWTEGEETRCFMAQYFSRNITTNTFRYKGYVRKFGEYVSIELNSISNIAERTYYIFRSSQFLKGANLLNGLCLCIGINAKIRARIWIGSKKQLGDTDVAQYLNQVADKLEYIKSCGLIQSDFKPVAWSLEPQNN